MKQVNFLKRVQGLMVLLMLVFAAPVLTACGSDDDEPEIHPIVGVWERVKIEVYDAGTGIYHENLFGGALYDKYAQDGTFARASDPEMTKLYARGTWKITGNKLKQKRISVDDGSTFEKDWTFTLTGNQLVLVAESDKERHTFERVK